MMEKVRNHQNQERKLLNKKYNFFKLNFFELIQKNEK